MKRWVLALALCAGACSTPPPAAENRDPHGPTEVDDYIERLESPTRLAELRPDVVIERLGPAPNAWVADIGCGPGVFALPFARAVPKGLVFAADVEPRQLDRLRARVADDDVHNVVPVLASLDDPHLPEGRFDVIFIGDTYHHFVERVAYVRDLARLLVPGGRLAILEYKPGPLPVGPPPEHKLGEGQLERELTEAGWQLEARFDTHTWHDFQVWVPAR
ncbi:MAG TPA: class I SAM-dependent methyltransferase [Planctomycetota bacterium]|nr:class I SAM-dependent methyltransferase [Planctomycetota bacterium]